MMYYEKGAAVGECIKYGYLCKFVVVGYSWLQVKPDRYSQYMIKRCINCGTPSTQLVHWIDIDEPFCLGCGSNDISGDNVCLVCNKREIFYLIPEEVIDGRL